MVDIDVLFNCLLKGELGELQMHFRKINKNSQLFCVNV